MEDNLSKRGNLALGLLRRIASRNDILISYGLDESSPYIETIKYFLCFILFCGQTQGLPLHITHYSLLITLYFFLHAIGSTLNLSQGFGRFKFGGFSRRDDAGNRDNNYP